MPTLQQIRSYGRVGWLATTLALAAALVVGSWVNYRGSRAAVSTLNRGQADLVEAALRNALPPWETEIDSTTLQAFVDSFPQYAVTYLAVLDSRGAVQASLGTPAAPPTPPQGRASFGGSVQLVDLGDRVRVYLPRAVFRRGRGRDRGESGAGEVRSTGEPGPQAGTVGDEPDSGEQAARPAGTGRGASATPQPQVDGRGPSGNDPLILFNIVEFEPVVASNLVSRASQSLVLSMISALILTLAALLFWRTSERYAAARIRIEEQRRLSVLGEMSAVLAHEIRNPLASLKGTAQLLAEKLPQGSRELKRADRIVTEAIRLENLTSDLLDFARTGPILIEDVDPAELVRNAAAEVGDSTIEIDATAAPRLWKIDSRRLHHALVNILQNALQAAPAEAPPRVTVTEEQKRLVYEIRDFGPGLPPEGEERVFDPFFTTRTNGTGLGLAVARRVAEMHGGNITARTHPEGGAIFRIVLPAQQS
jgi:two-component system sensor histidine kinase HydH